MLGQHRGCFGNGDYVIYRRLRHSNRPSRRAKHIRPAEHGEYYSYEVEKYWIVQDVLPDGKLLLRTRRGKIHEVASNDPQLRLASCWERWFLTSRFPARTAPLSDGPPHVEELGHSAGTAG